MFCLDKKGEKDWTSPLALAICSSRHDYSFRMTLVLCLHGAMLTEYDRRWTIRSDDMGNQQQEDYDWENHREWRRGLCACVDLWTEEHRAGADALTKFPIEVIERGEASVKTYLADMKRSSRDELVHRCKVCVAGPSEWGKTSLIQSITSERLVLIAKKDRTIGIDLTKCVLCGDDGSKHEVKLWDFAGQGMYHAAHTMFFSRRTLFILVIDLDAYSSELRVAETKSSQECELHMSRFVRSHIFKWVRTIFAHQPDARFVVVGTKVNLLEDTTRVQDVWGDLRERLEEWKTAFIKSMNQQISRKHAPSADVKDLQTRLSLMASDDWLVGNITSAESIADVRAALHKTIAKNDLGFPMWKMYRQVLEAVLKRRDAAHQAGSERERIEKSIIRFRTLRRQLMNEIEELERDECEQFLRTLNDLGDVLWYEHDSAGVFKDYVILDQMLVIEVVREVVRHDFSLNAYAELTGDGYVSHSNLSLFPLWRDMDKELIHAFKGLLQHFQLAYPTDADSMLPEPDIIVPAYWHANEAPQSHVLRSQSSVFDAFISHRWCWEYEVPGELAETIFEKFAVASHSSWLTRTIRGFCMEATCSEFASCISLHLGHSSRDIIRIEVSGDTAKLSWHNMRFYLMKMEKVLEAYKGDVIWRYIIHKASEDSQESRYPVGSLVKLLEDTILMGRDVDALRMTTPWMPPDMDWYLHKAWNDITSFQQLEMNELVRSKLLVLEKLAIAGDAPRQFPALWSLEYLPDEHKAIVRMHSDLTGLLPRAD